MYRTGHLGVAVCCYAPVAAGLAAVGESDLALVGAAVTLSLSSFPDCDLIVPGLPHRGPTHTVAFAFLVGLAFGAAGWVLGSAGVPHTGTRVGVVTGGTATLAILSHLLADALTPSGVRPFWPLSGRSYALGLTRADDWLWNRLLLSLGGLAAGVVVHVSV